MEFNFRIYQKIKTKDFLKNNNFLMLAYSSNKNSLNWLTTEQKLHKINFKYYKIYNNVTTKIIKVTLFKNFSHMVNSTLFLLKTTQIKDNKLLLSKNILLKSLQVIKFYPHYLKLNNKIYSISQIAKINSLEYMILIKILYQFLFANLKTCYIFNKKLFK